MLNVLDNYIIPEGYYDEVVSELNDEGSYYTSILNILKKMTLREFKALNRYAKLSFLNQGVTYALYNKEESVEQVFPFDLIPRIIKPDEWHTIETGVVQRNIALNKFIHDVYNGGKILKDKVIPERLIRSSKHYCSLMEGFTPPRETYCHISGTDIIRHSDGNFYVLEDNLRSPSGVSYVLTNRIAMTRVLPDIFNKRMIEPVGNYTDELLKSMWSVSNRELGDIFCVLLTPGSYNSAYFEHTYLAKKMGIELVEGTDLFVEDDYVYLKTIGAKIRVDVIYRRIDDDFLDPEVFRPESMLGVPGLMRA